MQGQVQQENFSITQPPKKALLNLFEQEPEIDETEDTQAILEDLMTYE